MRIRSLLLASILVIPGAALADSMGCKPQQDALSASGEKYKATYADYQKDGEDMEKDSASFKFDVTWKDTDIDFDTPTVTVRDQHVVFGVPQVTVRQRDMSFDTPSIRMNPVKIGQTPNFTCHDTWIEIGPLKTKGAPACTTTWTDNFTDMPTTVMETHRISVGVPDFSWSDVDIVMGVPEFSLQHQHWTLGLPQFTLIQANLNQQKLTDESNDLQARISATRTAQKLEMASGVHALYACYRQQVVDTKQTALSQFAGGLAQLDAAIQSLAAQGADPTKVPGDGGTTINLPTKRTEIAAKRDAAAATFDTTLAKLDDSEKTAVAGL